MPMPDLITTEYATRALAAGGFVPTAAQAAALPAAIASASAVVRRHCGDRHFNRRAYREECVTRPGGLVVLDQLPVLAVSRIAGGPTPGLTLRSDATAQRAGAGLLREADEWGEPAAAGILLRRVVSGVTTEVPLTFEDHPTIGALAAAASQADGWTAEAATGYAEWASDELDDGKVVRHASRAAGATLDVLADDLDGDLDAAEGLLRVRTANSWGIVWGDDDEGGHRHETRGGRRVRVLYEAGFDAIPMDVQLATAEAVADMLRQVGSDTRLSSETVGNRSQVYNVNIVFPDYALGKGALGKLAPYRIIRT